MLWKTLYSLFRELPNEQQMYQSIASVGNMLLKLGEFGCELETNDGRRDRQSKSIVSNRLMDLPVTEHESGRATLVGAPPNNTDLLKVAGEVTVISDLVSSTSMKEAFNGVARSNESSLSSPVRSCTDDDFVLVGSDEGFSTPETVANEQDDTVQDTLDEVYSKLAVVDHAPSTDCRQITAPSEDNRNLLPGCTDGCFCSSVLEDCGENCGANKTDDQSINSRSSGAVDPKWSISFEQFLASMLTEPYLVHYFDETVDVLERLKKMKTEGIGKFRNPSRRNVATSE